MKDLVQLAAIVVSAKDAIAAVEVEVQAYQATFADELAAEKKASFDEGFSAGAASVGSDKIFSQAEVDALLAEKNSELESVKAELDGVKAELETVKSDFDAKVAAIKTQALEAFDAQQADESASEADYRAKIEAL